MAPKVEEAFMQVFPKTTPVKNKARVGKVRQDDRSKPKTINVALIYLAVAHMAGAYGARVLWTSSKSPATILIAVLFVVEQFTTWQSHRNLRRPKWSWMAFSTVSTSLSLQTDNSTRRYAVPTSLVGLLLSAFVPFHFWQQTFTNALLENIFRCVLSWHTNNLIGWIYGFYDRKRYEQVLRRSKRKVLSAGTEKLDDNSNPKCYY